MRLLGLRLRLRPAVAVVALLVASPALLAPLHAWHGLLGWCHHGDVPRDAAIGLADPGCGTCHASVETCGPTTASPAAGGAARVAFAPGASDTAPTDQPVGPAPGQAPHGADCPLCVLALVFAPVVDEATGLPAAEPFDIVGVAALSCDASRPDLPFAARGPPAC